MKETRQLKKILKQTGMEIIENGVLYRQNETKGEGYIVFATPTGRYFAYGFFKKREYVTNEYLFIESALGELMRKMGL